ncbi:sugar transferase [Fulvivirga lutea]|uniref:Sugar transferase n=1 Tax=Fulvivirga lutea TaxID=2810512 RepID=A0A974WEE4_9BACT|nr:sugar transferase [Fulvivirga lutea]QSE96793.1 sugar transferase [Fulvivirga lutea]
MYRRVIKRIFDYTLASLIFVTLFMPLYMILLMYWQGNPLFRQFRAGKLGQPFQIYKFKSMHDVENIENKDEKTRVTKIGKILRKSSLDEVPQVLNIFAGHMTFIGPRPLLIEYLDLYNNIQMRRHDILPGITGWAQVNGRDKISWRKKFELDIYYVNNQSFWLDLKILLMTLYRLISRPKEAGLNFQKFTGNN